MIDQWPRVVKLPCDSDTLWDIMERLKRHNVSFQYEALGDILGRYGALWIGEAPKSQRPLCGALTRMGTPCKAHSVNWWNRRCRMHGGLSTGPKTPEGRAAIAESNRRRAKAKKPGSL